MGPQSVIFTWSENFKMWPGDEEAERMVQRSDLVVYPESEEEAGEESDEKFHFRDGGMGKRKRPRKLTKRTNKEPRTPKRFTFIPRKLFKLKKIGVGVGMEKQTAVAGVVLLLGIGLAVYNVKRSGSGGVPTSGGTASGVGGGGGGWKPTGGEFMD
jgi:hypothetical protein